VGFEPEFFVMPSHSMWRRHRQAKLKIAVVKVTAKCMSAAEKTQSLKAPFSLKNKKKPAVERA
jgi:hypothetical protein